MATIGTGELLKDRYRLERTLGRGGMAAVWLGQDEVLERPVAVKVLADTIAADPGFVARFRREAQIAAGVSHPNLVGVYDFSEEGERPYLVMQFVPGEDLAAKLERGRGWTARSWPGKCWKRWHTSTAPASSTATSSPATSSSNRTGRRS